jgi:hypothetical protein
MLKRTYGCLRRNTYQLFILIRDYAPDIYNTYEYNIENIKTKKQIFIMIHNLNFETHC